MLSGLERQDSLASAADYAYTNAMFPSAVVYSIDTPSTTCCLDVCTNCREEENTIPLGRECTPVERNKISMQKVAAKQITSVVLIGIVSFYLMVEYQSLTKYGEIFNCDLTDPNSMTFGIEQNYKDQGKMFCMFKSVMIVISWVILMPYFLETFSIVTIIWVSSINDDVVIPISEGEYVGYDSVFNQVLSKSLMTRFFCSFCVIFCVPGMVWQMAARKDGGFSCIDAAWIVGEMAWKFVAFMLPDIVLTILLFPVSYYVMQSSGSVPEIVVNLVAVQVFATLDDVFVKMLLRPRASVGEAIQNYVTINPKATVAKYRPMEAYLLTQCRNEMGVKVISKPNMREFHDYEGMHFH